jgi:hypothetical protein
MCEKSGDLVQILARRPIVSVKYEAFTGGLKKENFPFEKGIYFGQGFEFYVSLGVFEKVMYKTDVHKVDV